MAKRDQTLVAGETNLVVNSSKFLLWNRLEGSLSLGATERHFQVKCGAWTIHGRLIEGQYPNWRQVVPADPGSESFTLDPADMPVLDEAVQTLPVTNAQ